MLLNSYQATTLVWTTGYLVKFFTVTFVKELFESVGIRTVVVVVVVVKKQILPRTVVFVS